MESSFLKKDEHDKKQNMSVRQLLREQRELEEKRKFGLAPLSVDVVTKQEISPNVPQSIARAPWYYGVQGTTLDHQRRKASDGTELKDAYDRLNDEGEPVLVVKQQKQYAPGACTNCGSRTHKAPHCILPKKKVGAKYTGVVTGLDVTVLGPGKAQKEIYTPKRERFSEKEGVNLMRQVLPEKDERRDRDADRNNDSQHKRGRTEDAFAKLAAQHGGVEIQPLPKYLENLDEKDVFFDPKMGAMRENPNVHDPTRLFQGDLQRYRSGDYYNYVEAQYRYLTGKSKSFVDFELDEELRRAKEPAKAELGGNTTADKVGLGEGKLLGEGKAADLCPGASEAPEDVIVRSLYGASARLSTDPASKS